MTPQPSTVLAFVSVLLLLTIKPHEACRSIPRDDDEPVWMKKKHYLLLPSLQWKPVSPPGGNPGTNGAVNSATLGGKDFAATSTPGSLRKHVLLPSLWKPVTPPTPNPGTNSALAGAKNFAGGLLRSLKWRPVNPPSSNPGHNSIGTVKEQNYAAAEMSAHQYCIE
ncbi:PREDICTED: uncharacterized protein LOC109161179 [Ipomoea nil]|uniref:uncharacterized protein LOC109161179 n=1 Tax=Ipomoea nil TaxID=35883 RepID=UPI000900CC40|nr:PREDICTED: uncharacterized protein LOC109161179 [Ipomoea nil]